MFFCSIQRNCLSLDPSASKLIRRVNERSGLVGTLFLPPVKGTTLHRVFLELERRKMATLKYNVVLPHPVSVSVQRIQTRLPGGVK